jgi:hypothetical protein
MEGAGVPAGRSRLPNVAAFALALGLVFLGGQIVRQGLTAENLDDRPGAALWGGDSPDALSSLGRQRLLAKDAAGASRLAAAALRRAPLTASALTTWGLAQERLGHAAAASQAMTLAGRLGWRDAPTQAWLLRRDLLAFDFPDGLAHADALLRRQDVPPPILLRLLASVAQVPQALPPLGERLAAAPAWRGAFIAYLAAPARPDITDILGAMLARLARGPTPPNGDELAVYLRALVAEQRFDDARRAWAALDPRARDAGLIFDGDFSRPPAATPFDWSLEGGVGWTPTLTDSIGEGGHGMSLNLQYDGASPSKPLRQLLVLAPGAYRLSGIVYDEVGASAGALAWTLTCVGQTQPVATQQPTLGPKAAWRPFSLDFVVPPTGCEGQWLTLAATPGERPQEISAWYDDLSIAAAP